MARALRLATLAASLWIASAPALAAAVALVTDLQGEARIAGGAKIAFLGELPPAARLVLDKGATLTLIYVGTGTEFKLAGPGEFVVEAVEVKAASGSAPSRRTVVARPDPATVSRLAESATASVRMRSANAPKAPSKRPELLYPRSAQIAVLQPTLSWNADVPADGFTVVVTGADGKQAWRGNAKSTSARVGTKLSPASRYTWTLQNGETYLGEASFETLSADAIRRAEAARSASRTFSDRILHALVLQDIGAAQDARLAWAESARERPELPELAALAPLYAMRRLLLVAIALFVSAGAAAADRVALLIGNNAYAASPLRNAVNDARDLADTLKELGFRVIVKQDATRKDMIDALKEFGSALDGASTALFFYAGHAMQFKERNYLIPIDAAMGSEEDITFFSVEVNQVFDRMDRAKTRFNFIVLDACRDNPFASSFKVSSAGLAQISAPAGTLIAYATSPGAVAQDGYGRNGVYTRFILQNIKVPDLPVEIMFKRVREAVSKETRLLQTPWDSSSLKGDFVFNASGRAPAVAAAGPSADIQLQIEREFWSSVRESNRADDIQAYLDKYPNGNFAQLARNRLNLLVRPAEPAARVADPSTLASTAAMPRDPNPEPAMTPRSAPGPAAAARPAERPVERPVPQVVEKPVEKPAEKPVVVAAAPASAPPSAPAVAPPPVPAPAIVAPPPAPKKDEQPGREIVPGVREVVFADGSVYKGGMRGFVQHGKGEYVSKAFQYQGEFKDGLKHGAGTYSWEGGDRYEGEFADDRPNGSGKWRFSTGDMYEGEVKAGKIVGRGTYTSKSGDMFSGSFVEGRPHGVGVYRFASGDRYEGEMIAGVMNGKGRYITQTGDKIEAPFVAGRANGRGTYMFSNGDRYEGDIRDGVLTGNGVYSYASGQRYEGELRAGEPQGTGTYWFVDGTRFEGKFEGLAKASGTVVNPDGSKAPAEMVGGALKWLK